MLFLLTKYTNTLLFLFGIYFYRHYQQLKTSKDVWTPAEDAKLEKAFRALGNQWRALSEIMTGRSEMAIKNRCNTIFRAKGIEGPPEFSNKPGRPSKASRDRREKDVTDIQIANAVEKSTANLNNKPKQTSV